jgi:superfamily II DNA or RNA helicase
MSTRLAMPGTLVHARGREWVVLPDSTDELLLARPLGGLDEEVAGLMPAIEPVQSATFSLPSLADVGDFTSGRLLRDAARLSTRAAAGPFRSFGRIATEPRPYQLVPLMMALRLDPVRLLIADDVGIGKTVEAALIARELLDRGEIRRMAVLCPPHLAEQWQRELLQKFHIEAELVLSSTVQRLERNLTRRDESIFDHYPVTIVSLDFVKSQRRADDFVLKCPEFVIVDEAHGCTVAGGVGRGRQQRFELLRRIASDPKRHLVLVTATPHSGDEGAFRSLLSLLDDEFGDMPTDLERAERESVRRKLAAHLVQRRRADIRHYLATDTAFPMRKDREVTYELTPEYRKVFDDILEFAQEYVSGEHGERQRRVRYWSALALLRCVSSSPQAAASTLRSRAAVDAVETDDVERVGEQTVLDQDDTDDVATVDLSPGSDMEANGEQVRKRLLQFARRADALPAGQDAKLQAALSEVKKLLKDGFHPVVFCRFMATAEHVAKEFRDKLGARIRVEAVTGELSPADRESRIEQLVSSEGDYVLVCTDCLSEGINLQAHFDAVLHYDLTWNPTRHEQREGRVDRFGQKKSEVRVVTLYGADNPIDGVILDVLIRKHKAIRSTLGVAVAVPSSSEHVAKALFEGALFRRQAAGESTGQQRFLFHEGIKTQKNALHASWDEATAREERERATRSRFAQNTLRPELVAQELASVRAAVGGATEVSRFTTAVLRAARVPIKVDGPRLVVEVTPETQRSLRQAIGMDDSFAGRFELPTQEDEFYLSRTHPIIEGLASWTLDQAMDTAPRDSSRIAARCGVVATSAVKAPTRVLVARFRAHLRRTTGAETLLTEEIVPLACTGSADAPNWLGPDEAESLLSATPDANLGESRLRQQLELLIGHLPRLQLALEPLAAERASAQLEAHERVRQAARVRGKLTVEPILPVDILGAYLLLPA